jgi:hypothetical protein
LVIDKLVGMTISVGCTPDVVVFPSLVAVELVPSVWAVKATVAWLEMIELVGLATMATLNLTVVDAAGAKVPPVVAVAPVPSRKTTRLFVLSYSAWSLPDVSVLVPLFAPAVTCRLFGT